jgi:hypothetical protein
MVHALAIIAFALNAQTRPAAAPSAQWIWAPGAASSDRVYFRQPFRLADTPELVKLSIAARGKFSVYINGGLLVRATPSEEYQSLFLTPYVMKGQNVLAIACDSATGQNGLRFELAIRYKTGRTAVVQSNGDERISKERLPNWERPDFDDRTWQVAAVIRMSTPATGASATATQAPAPALPAVQYDFSRLVRIWDIEAGGREGGNPYTRRRSPGERMILSAGSATPNDYGLLSSTGFTLLESSSDHLSTDEVSPGVWDFSRVSLQAFQARRAGFDSSYFPHFAFPPAWYRDKTPFTLIQCLEHDQPVQAFSPWDQRLSTTAERGFDQLNRRFRGGELLNGLYLGIHGDFGEAGLLSGARVAVPSLRDDWEKRFGNAHNHLGWWCADALAQDDFRERMLRKYSDLEGLNAAWGTKYHSRGDIRYPTAPGDGKRRYWLDFVEWYLGSVAAMTGDLAQASRKSFPDTLTMLPMGFADENPRGGNDNSLLAKVAAEHRLDVRSTHAGYKTFASSQAGPMGRIASAARFYGAPFWSEPPGKLTAEEEVSRLFAAASFGSKGLFDWTDNIRQHRDLYYRYGKYLTYEPPVVDVAMFFPTSAHLMRANSGYPPTFEKGCTEIRDVLNYDIVDERMIWDGALDRYRVLVLWEGTIAEAATLARIRDWVQAGGVIAAYDFGKIETVEGDRGWFSDLFGFAGRLKPAGAQFRYESTAAIPARFRISPAQASANSFLSGDWYPSEGARAASRWTGAVAEVRVPVDPNRRYSLLVRASFPPETAKKRRDVLVNGVRVGELDSAEETTYSFRVPPNALGPGNAAVVTIDSDTWTMADVQRGSTDRRPLGTAIYYVQMEPAGGLSPATDPGVPSGRFVTALDMGQLRTEWSKPYGKGWTVFFPARRQQLAGYYELIRALTYHLSDLDSTKRDALPVDDAWDGVYATQFANKVLYFNPGTATVKRTANLPASLDAARTGGASAVNIEIEPNAIVPVYLDTPPQEMLYQCEGFKTLGSLKPLTGASFSPGRGVTHVLIPAGAQIETRIQVDTPGRYRVFYRAIRRGGQAQAEVLLDGRSLDREREPLTRGLPGSNGTLLAGTVELTRGVHTLTLRPRPGEDARADFVILTSDSNVAGYGFAVPPVAARRCPSSQVRQRLPGVSSPGSGLPRVSPP